MGLHLFWGKSKNDGDEYMTVLQHSRDICWAIPGVADELLSPATRDFLADSLGEAKLDDVLTFAAISHDVGKISPFFQQKVPRLSQRLHASGYGMDVTPREMSANPHSIISAQTMLAWIEQRTGKSLGMIHREFWYHVIAGHHGSFSEMSLPSDDLQRELRLWPEWQRDRFELLDTLTAEMAIDDNTINSFTRMFDEVSWDNSSATAAAALITGLLISADWVASSEQYFPLTNDESPNQEWRVADAAEHIDFGGHWEPTQVTVDTFVTRFSLPKSAAIRNVQRAAIEVGEAQTQPSFTIIENETGSGKTEAALALAEITAKKFGFTGLFFAQPTRITSDAIFSRVAEWLKTSSTSDAVSTVLAHGKAEFNEEFKAITPGRLSPIYDDDTSNGRHPLEATQWFQGKKTGLLASVAVGTIDQILFAVLQSKHNVLRHLGLAGKVVVIDEMHAADAYMRVYVTRLLEWLGFYRVPVIALSATLPPATRDMLIDAYHQGAAPNDGTVAPVEETGPVYPRITWNDGHRTETIAPAHDGLTRMTQYSFAEGDLEEMADKALSLSTDGGCIGIICSTVSRAQELYSLISAREAETVLLHSRFLTVDRMKLEATLVRQLGRKAIDTRPEKLIVVSTQIIEQGLDLDFDAMISDIAPVDLLIQRIGRLHRHASLNDRRPVSLRKPTLTIFGAGVPDTSAPAPILQSGSRRVYRSAPLLRSARVLAEHSVFSGGTITTPEDVEKLVSTAYDFTQQAPEQWRSEWETADAEDRKFQSDQEARAKHARIPGAYAGNLPGWSKNPSIADEQAGAAQVRDADESFEVVVVRNDGGRLRALPHVVELEGYPVDGVMELESSIARTLATCTVRLPGWSLGDNDLRNLEADGQESWQQSRWLRGSLPLVLDSNLSRKVDRYIFHYDRERGLLMERKD